MLAYVKGTLQEISGQAVVIDNHGIGYLINVSTATLSRLPARGSELTLHTYMQVKEDGISLFGFLSREEVRLFLLLISVSGIGPKMASAILSALSPQQLVLAIVTDDAAALSKAPGVGKKTAQRIVLELRDKMKTDGASFADGAGIPSGSFAAFEQADGKQEAMDALLALGYSRSEALKAVLECATEGMKTEQIIKEALRKLARSL
jgi:Holliday junction DNA helicase RuvA